MISQLHALFTLVLLFAARGERKFQCKYVNIALQAEFPSIFLDKSVILRPRHSLIWRSSNAMDETVQRQTGQTGFSLLRMIALKNSCLFPSPLYVAKIDLQTWQVLCEAESERDYILI